MKKFKSILILLLAIFSALFFIASCKDDGADSATSGTESVEPAESGSEGQSESTEREYENGEYTLLGFESERDLYSVRPYIADILDMYATISVVSDKSFAKTGDGSLKYHYESGKRPTIAFYPEHSDYSDIPIDKLAKFSVSVYNPSEKTESIKLVIASGKEPVYEQECELKNGWNDYDFELDPILLRFRKDEIKAFCIEFTPSSKPCDYYVDDWKATVGEKELNETQKTALKYVEKVDELGNMSNVDPAALLTAYGYYEQLDDACRAAVYEYRDKYDKALKRFFDYKSFSGGNQKTTHVFLSEDYGVLQVGETANTSAAYNGNAFGEGVGGTEFTFSGFNDKKTESETAKDETLKFDVSLFTSTIIVSNYDYVAFTVKNDSDKTVTIKFNGSVDCVTVKAGETVDAELPMTNLVESGNVMSFEFDYKTGETNAAKVSVSTIFSNALSRENTYESALTSEKYAKDGNVEVDAADGKYVLKFGDNSAKVALKKAFGEINVSQQVMFSVTADKNAELEIYNSANEKIRAVSLSTTADVVTLGKDEYEAAAYFKASESCKVTVSDMYLARTVDEDYVDIALKNDYIVKGDGINVDTVREAIYFVSSYENMSTYKQNLMKESDTNVYDDIIARSAKISEVFKGIVDSLKNGKSTDTENKIILDLSNQYGVLSTVTPLTKEEEKVIEEAKRSTLLKYKYTVFDFENPMAATDFEKVTRWFEWGGNITLEDFDGGKKLAVNVQRVQPDGDRNARRIWIGYDYSKSSAVLGGYDYVSWRIYNANATDKTIFFITYGWSATVTNLTLKANSWTDIKLGVNDFKNAGYFVIFPTDPGEKYYFDNAYACSAEYVQNLIDKIPEVGTIKESDRTQINFARTEYDKLSALAKKKVVTDRLVAAEKKISTLPCTVFDMSDESVLDRFTNPKDIPAYLWNGDFSIVNNETNGKVLAVHTTGTYGTQTVVYMGYNLDGIDLSGYDYVTFSVYNPKNVQLDFAIITKGWGKSYYKGKLKATDWTEITVSTDGFKRAGYFYFADVLANEEVTFLISNVVAHGAASVQGTIDELPEAVNMVYADIKDVMYARSQYEKLSDAAKKQVDITKLLACEEAAANIPYKIYDMSDGNVLSKFKHSEYQTNYVWNGDFSIVDDETNGKVLALHTTGTTGTQPVVYFGYNLEGIDISAYSTVTFKVYNPKNASLQLAFITRGWGSKSFDTYLTPQGWTEVTLTTAQLKNAGYIYIANVNQNEELTFLFTDFIAKK